MASILTIYWTNTISRPRLSYVKLRRFCSSAARFLAFLALASPISLLAADHPSSIQPNSATTVVFYAESKVEGPIWPAIFSALHQELARENHEYPLPEKAQLLRAGSVGPGQEFEQVIQVHLVGRCDVVQQAYRPLPRGPLGWVLRVNGQIQPFVYVDCTRLAQYLDPMTLGMNGEQRTHTMAEAVARVLVHEWIHIATQSGTHSDSGIERAWLTASDLTDASEELGEH